MLTSIRNVKFYIKWNTMFITAVGITNYKNFYGLRPGKRIQHLLPTSVRFCWRMLTGSGGPTGFNTYQHLIQQSPGEARYSVPGCSRGGYYGYGVVTMETDMETSSRDRLVRAFIPNNVERREQTALTLLNIRDNKRNVRFNMF